MTTVPDPNNPQNGLTCTYDAWNRMVQVASGTTIVGQYEYDGQNRRIDKLTTFNSSGVPQNVEYDFYDGQQIVETRDGAPTSSPSIIASPIPVHLVAALRRRPDPERFIQWQRPAPASLAGVLPG